jgi:hypothetical protein
MRAASTFAAAAAFVVAAAGCAAVPLARGQGSVQDSRAREPLTADCARWIGISGLEAPLSIGELTRRADLVVVGTVIADQVERFTSVPGVPLEDRDPLIYAFGSYHDATVEVGEYLKGSGASRMSVRRLASTRELCVSHEQPELAVGTQYVLFLERGRGVWIGGHIAFGRGTAVVTNGVARFRAFGDPPPFLLRLLMSLP